MINKVFDRTPAFVIVGGICSGRDSACIKYNQEETSFQTRIRNKALMKEQFLNYMWSDQGLCWLSTTKVQCFQGSWEKDPMDSCLTKLVLHHFLWAMVSRAKLGFASQGCWHMIMKLCLYFTRQTAALKLGCYVMGFQEVYFFKAKQVMIEFDVKTDETDYLNRLVQIYGQERKQYTGVKRRSRQIDQRQQKKIQLELKTE